jgi:hypothetical protein
LVDASGERRGPSVRAVLACAGVKVRHRRGWLSLAVIAGLVGGAVLTCVAGGRRTDSAYARFARAHLAGDVIVFPPFGAGLEKTNFDQLSRLPEVSVATILAGYNSDGPITVAPTGAYGTTINVPKLLSGRLPRPDRPDEVALTSTFARTEHLSVGSHLAVRFFGPASATGQPSLVAATFRVVGVEVSPGDFPPTLQATFFVQVMLTPAFVSQNQPRLGPPLRLLVVRLRHGDADAPAFLAGARRLTAGGQPQLATRQATQATNVQRGFHLQALALWFLAAFLGVAAALVLWQLVARQSMLAAEDHRVLRALGLTRIELWLSAMAPAVAVGAVGGLLAVVLAIAASPLLPVGTARVAEPHPGLAVDWTVLALGGAGVLVAVTVLAIWPTWRAASGPARELETTAERPSLVERVATSGAVPPAASVGMTMALQPGRGRTAVPVRSSLVGVALAVAALTAALTFGASLTHLLGTPALYGWNWDAHISTRTNNNQDPGSAGAFNPLLSTLGSDERVGALASLESVPLVVGQASVNGVSLRSLKGSISPVVLHGRAPQGSDEVALGARTMRDIHAHVGDTVPVSLGVGRPLRSPKRVVGVVVLPPQDDAARLGVGAMLTQEGDASLFAPGQAPKPRSEAVLRLRPGVDRAAGLAGVQREVGVRWAVTPPRAPTDLVNFGHVQNLPLVLASLLALLAVATLAHTLVSSVRRRSRDLAVLKTLGMLPVQVRRAVTWQSVTVAAVALLLGMPLGVAGGRLLWDLLANQLGTVARPVTPLTLLGLIPLAVAMAVLVAAAPAVLAARTAPASVLRGE